MDATCPAIWPEEEPPKGVESCMDCGLFEHGSRMIWGEGNPHAPIMVVLDNPGAREDRHGNPFVCGTRETLQKAAYETGLEERDVYVTYVLKRRPTRAYDKEGAREACMQHLLVQLQSKTPQLVFCLGNVATQAFFANREAEVKALRQQWHFPRGVKTAVSYHPLAVRRRPNLWADFLEDWKFLVSVYKKSRQ
ncbi:uracil-DNA glycosylase [Brevibacillus borstelensis]|uniref:uracil-DNA glycosylase n=1 Tax=Brevibacillus borstelensis TaxID=45462 RepID=UPI000468A48E|nr:uracil-DNA glycosylase [Brevibacillus borstelensis]MCM3591650.1 uracil-DNA glycosylase [Brevibacillus borstelensis]MCM3623400.1 uracil-DNA glycosylase [Brevibacillus borstelensis]